eukprot:1338407-Alexandrium_andersonii.AAC.1
MGEQAPDDPRKVEPRKQYSTSRALLCLPQPLMPMELRGRRRLRRRSPVMPLRKHVVLKLPAA